MGCGQPADSRAVSNLLGITILIAIVAVGALVVITTGASTVSDVNRRTNTQLAEETLQQAGTQFRDSASTGGVRQVTIPDTLQGGVSANETATYRLRLNGNPECSSGTHNLGSLRYTEGDTLVGYQAGGVWRLSESGASMVSPPSITYDQGQLTMTMPNVTGDVTRSDQIRVSSNNTQERNFENAFSAALYTDLDPGQTNTPGGGSLSIVCPPADVQTVELYVNDSAFAGAWVTYVQRNFDDQLVSVTPSGNVDPGTNLTITFTVGDVSDPDYQVSNLSYSRSGAGSGITVTANVTNDGGLQGTADVAFGYAGAQVATRTETFDGGQRRELTATIPRADLQTGSHQITVSTADDSQSTPVSLSSVGGMPNVQITAATVEVEGSPSTTANPGDDARAVVDVENTGGMTANDTVVLEYHANGVDASRRRVSLDPGGTRTLTFDLSTRSDGDHALDLSMRGSGDTASTHLVVGSNFYYGIDAANAPTQVTAGDQFTISGTVENTGDLPGNGGQVTVAVFNTTTGYRHETTASLSLDGTIAGSGSRTVDLQDTIAPSEAGVYHYEIVTPNATRQGTFTVGAPQRPNFVVSSLSADPNPMIRTAGTELHVTVSNQGEREDEQPVTIDAENASTQVQLIQRHPTLGPGDTYSDSFTVAVTNRLSPGTYTLEATTENASLTQQLVVEPANSSIDDGDGTILVDEHIDARVRLLGAELEGYGYLGRGWYYIVNSPTRMWLHVENDSGTYDVPLWQSHHNGDVNNPYVEQDLLNSGGPDYERNVTLDPGANVSVYATSYSCNGWSQTSVRWRNIDIQGDGRPDRAVGYECSRWGRPRIRVDDLTNTRNVVINRSGERVPSFGAADPYQRGIDQMLPGDRINGSGYLDLPPGERLFLYELSQPDASPGNAQGGGDPDYNDAAVLFQVVNVRHTRLTPADFAVREVDAPISVSQGDAIPVDALLNNSGGQAGTANLTLSFGGTDVAHLNGVHLDGGQHTTRTLTVPGGATSGRSGAVQYTVSINGSSNRQSGTVTIGSPSHAVFQITSIDAPDAVDSDASPRATVTVRNTGATSGTQQVRLDDAGGTDSRTVSLSSGASRTLTFDLPDASLGTGTSHNYVVSTDDVSIQDSIYVGDSNVEVAGVEVGLSSYSAGELISRRSIPALSVKLHNVGTFGDSRTVGLEITNRSDGSTAFDDQQAVQVGQGPISTTVPAWANFSPNLDTGYYNYTISVYDGAPTPANRVDQWTGRIYIRETGGASSDTSNSPISIDSNQISVSDD
ncbi:MAG: hypothetical protein ABEJ89_00755 [Haloarculaceae archaeon]